MPHAYSHLVLVECFALFQFEVKHASETRILRSNYKLQIDCGKITFPWRTLNNESLKISINGIISRHYRAPFREFEQFWYWNSAKYMRKGSIVFFHGNGYFGHVRDCHLWFWVKIMLTNLYAMLIQKNEMLPGTFKTGRVKIFISRFLGEH